MGCPVVHWELWSEDPDKAAEFYGKVFDWEIRSIPEMAVPGVGSFSLFEDPDGRVLGMWKQNTKEAGS